MSDIDFPSAPGEGATHQVGTVRWVWDGVKWISAYLSSSSGSSYSPMLTVTGTVTLPVGYVGFVKVENATTAPMTVFLPPSPTEGQQIEIKDTLGNAATYPITVDGFGALIEGAATMAISFNYGWVGLMYAGTQWVQT